MRPLSSLYRLFQQKVLSGQAGMWVSIGVLVGIAAGLGSLALYNLIKLVTEFLLTGLSGFRPPVPGVEGGTGGYVLSTTMRAFIPLSTTIGGLVSGYLVYRLSPGTEGLGINAAVRAFHNLTIRLKNRTPAVKLAASAIVIGSGGSAGRDGPVALISAVFGSFLSDYLGLDDHDRRIVMASAIGAGFGSIFMAPIGGAIMSTEILYRKDFEVEALIPAVIASVVGYAIFGLQFHYSPLFQTSPGDFLFLSLNSIAVYVVIGVMAGLGGRVFVGVFDAVHAGFSRLKNIPVYLKPAIGGLIVGCIGLFFPQVLGLGYGWVQMILKHQPLDVSYAINPIPLFAGLFFLKIIATSITIGSGGSGGVFAPSIVTGAFLGATLGTILHPIFPSVTVPEATIVTMLSFFAAVSKTPVAMLIMGTEMAGGLDMFVPLMIGIVIAFFTCGANSSIYGTQVSDRMHSPAHLFEYRSDILDALKVSDTMSTDYLTAAADSSIEVVASQVKKHGEAGAVVSRNGRVEGYLSGAVIRSSRNRSDMKVSELLTEAPDTVGMSRSIHDAIGILPADSERKIVVVDDRTGGVVGVLGFSEVADAYETAFRELKLRKMRR